MIKKRPPPKSKTSMQIEKTKALLEKYSELLELRDAVEQAVRVVNEHQSPGDEDTSSKRS